MPAAAASWTGLTERPGLYVHVPLCRSKCHYCGFYSVAEPQLEQPWLAALQLEADRSRPDWPAFDTCYVGGGTPSALSDAGIDELARIVSQTFTVSPGAECTLEVNPADVTRDRTRRWRELGFQRVSLGVQSLRDDELHWLGRRHDAAQAVAAVDLLRSAGFERLGVDLIQGLPGQSLQQRLESVDRALALRPDHLSCYELTVEPDTPLADDVAAGRCSVPDSDAAADHYLAVSRHLRERGWSHYEVSSFARTPADLSRHNAKYWCHAPYLGLGPAAHSFRAGQRWSNERSVERYCDSARAGTSAVARRECLTDEQLRWERVALGLRTSRGIEATDVARTAASRAALAELIEQGLLRREHERYVPSVGGYLLADAMARRLLFDARTS